MQVPRHPAQSPDGSSGSATDARYVENQNLTKPFCQLKLFTPEECRRIYTRPETAGERARVERSGANYLDENQRRTTRYPVSTHPQNRWIFSRLAPAVVTLNEQHYRFRIGGLSSLDILEYGPGDFFGWHLDIGESSNSKRKLSCVVMLSDPADYAGGRLQFGPSGQTFPAEQGSLVIFPSYLVHQVEPISQGIRRTLVFWAHGDAFS